MIKICKSVWHDSDDFMKTKSIKYDDIVDDKDFASLKNQSRLERLSQEGANVGAGSPNYDFQPKKKRSFGKVSDEMLALRSGKLDKADVAEIKKNLESEISEELDKAQKEKLQKEAEEISRQRQEFIDGELGFKPSSNSESV